MPRAKERQEHIVYLIENLVNDKVYVGKTGLNPQRRFGQHLKNAANGLPGLLYNSIRKHGEEWFSIRVLGKTSSTFVNHMEKMYILIYDSQNRDKGYNLTSGGDGGITRVGHKITEAHKEAIRKSSTGRKWSPEQRIVLMAARAKQSIGRKGVPRPDLKGRASPMKGRKHSPESLAKQLATKFANGNMRDPSTPKPKYKWKPVLRTEDFWIDFRKRQSETTKKQMRNNPPTLEARLKMREASKRYWAEVKSKGLPLSNAARAV